MPAPQHAAPRAGQRPDQYAYLSRGGTLWSWPGQNPFRWRDPSGRLAQGILGPNVFFAGLSAYLVGYGFIGPWVFDQQDAYLSLLARAAARDRENQGRPNPGEACSGGSGGRGRVPPPAPVAGDDEMPAPRGTPPNLDAFSASGGELVKNGLTRAGLAYQKHMSRGELPDVAGRELNSVGQFTLDEILTNPQTKQVPVSSGNFPGGTRFIGPNGVGATFDAQGVFRYFGIYP